MAVRKIAAQSSKYKVLNLDLSPKGSEIGPCGRWRPFTFRNNCLFTYLFIGKKLAHSFDSLDFFFIYIGFVTQG